MASLGERIKARRQERGWTQEELARRAGISKGFLSDLENGKQRVGADTLLDVGRVLGASLDYLMTGDGVDPEPSEIEIPASLATFATEEGISFRQTLLLLMMQRQILAHRSTTKKQELDQVEWQKFYQSVKEFLE